MALLLRLLLPSGADGRGKLVTQESMAALSGDNERVLGGLTALQLPARNWQRWVAGGMSLAMLVAVALQLDLKGIAEVWGLIPQTPLFWGTLILIYMILPCSEWLIFRRLWRLPPAGLGALLRKRLSNDLLLGYSGELYFYAWARQHSEIKAAPFGAIKDVSILSALAANALTLILLAVMWPWISAIDFGALAPPVAASLAIAVLISIVAIAFGRKIFTLSGSELRFTFGVHIARLILITVLWGLLWHICLPDVALAYWLVLATLRLLVSRLTLIPSKDLLFATITMFLIGRDNEVSALMAMTATLMLGLNLLVGLIVAATGVYDARRVK
jgi:hypothetical protein